MDEIKKPDLARLLIGGDSKVAGMTWAKGSVLTGFAKDSRYDNSGIDANPTSSERHTPAAGEKASGGTKGPDLPMFGKKRDTGGSSKAKQEAGKSRLWSSRGD